MLPIVKRRKGCQQFADQNKDDQTLNESSLTKLVGAADMYNLDVSHLAILFYLLFAAHDKVSPVKLTLCA